MSKQTKMAGSAPRSKDEHMAKLAKVMPQRAVGKDIGVSHSTVGRKARAHDMLARGYTKEA